MIQYIESGVTSDSIEKDLAEVNRKISLIDSGYQTWLSHLSLIPDNSLAVYNRECGRPDLLKQKKSLEYLLA